MIAKNNIFNLRYNVFNCWKGQDGSNKGFCTFIDEKFGIRAALILLCRSYRKHGICTIEGIVSRFAPTTENDTENYINFVCNQTGYRRNQFLDTIFMYYFVLIAMARMENDIVLPLVRIKSVSDEFRINLLKIR